MDDLSELVPPFEQSPELLSIYENHLLEGSAYAHIEELDVHVLLFDLALGTLGQKAWRQESNKKVKGEADKIKEVFKTIGSLKLQLEGLHPKSRKMLMTLAQENLPDWIKIAVLQDETTPLAALRFSEHAISNFLLTSAVRMFVGDNDSEIPSIQMKAEKKIRPDFEITPQSEKKWLNAILCEHLHRVWRKYKRSNAPTTFNHDGTPFACFIGDVLDTLNWNTTIRQVIKDRNKIMKPNTDLDKA